MGEADVEDRAATKDGDGEGNVGDADREEGLGLPRRRLRRLVWGSEIPKYRGQRNGEIATVVGRLASPGLPRNDRWGRRH